MDKKIFLKELKNLLVARFGEDIKDVVLFGSRAIGKEHKDSDFDGKEEGTGRKGLKFGGSGEGSRLAFLYVLMK